MAAMNVSIVNELRVALDGIFSCVDSIPRKPLSTREKLDMLKRGEQGLRRCLQQVSETRSRVLSLRDDHSAIDKLPPELLLHIFEFAVFIDRSQHSWRRVPDLTWGPMELSFVCHRWRTLVLNTSSLWSTIVVHPGFPTDLFIERSKQHPVHFVYSKPSASLDSTSTRLNTHLTKRLRAVSCFAQTVRWFLAISGNFSFTSLQELELHSKSFVGSASPQRVVSAMPFPALKHVDLHNVCPSNIIRNTCTSPIRTARISFDSCIESGIRLNGLSMSRLHSFLTCTPELEQLTLGPGIPSMDVVLNRSTSGIGPLSLESTNLVSPVSLPQLHTLVWRAAPAKDLWRLFHIVDFPRLVTLDIALDSVEIRWPFVDGSLVVPMASYTTMSTYSLPPSISLNLKQLSLSCKDTLAASVALKKIAFPQLQDLTLIYNGVRYADTSSTLPAMKIFREPRMVNLTKLEVRNFSLDLEDTIIMLCHMQSLETLSLADCPGTDRVICVISSNGCCHNAVETPVKWICPGLQDLSIVGCPRTRFRCLETMVRLRKSQSETASTHTGRRIKPLRRTALAASSSFSPANHPLPSSPALATPKKVARSVREEDAAGSPNGSFIDGWRAHEPPRLRKLKTLHIKGCKRISEVELVSLMDEMYGVASVSWSP